MPDTRTIDLSISNKPNKDSEIRFITDLCENYPKDSYLSEFFSKDLAATLTEKIRNDFPCDLMAEWRQDSSDLEKVNKQIQIEKDQRKSDKEAFDTKLQEWKDHCTVLQDEAIIHFQTIGSLDNQLIAAREELRKHQQKITELKAEIYDLTHTEP